jgi:hypothetical protein
MSGFEPDPNVQTLVIDLFMVAIDVRFPFTPCLMVHDRDCQQWFSLLLEQAHS